MTEWDRILQEEWFRREEPDDLIIELAGTLKEKMGQVRVLDVGCGAGRHLVYLASQGFETHGMDLSETGLKSTKKRLRDRNLCTYIVKSDMKTLPYVKSCFDAVVCLHTVYHQRLAGVHQTISEIRRVLRTHGWLLMNFLSKRTYSYGKGKQVEGDTFMETEGIEKGILHHFADKAEIERLLKGFETIDLKLNEKDVEGRLRSRWVVLAMG